MWLNFVDNAVKFNGDGGPIRIALSTAGKDARLLIGNTRRGLSELHRARLFVRFFRGDSARSREVSGFGLGLSLSREIMHAHTGHIALAHREADWTEFLLSLPLAIEIDPAQASETALVENSFSKNAAVFPGRVGIPPEASAQESGRMPASAGGTPTRPGKLSPPS